MDEEENKVKGMINLLLPGTFGNNKGSEENESTEDNKTTTKPKTNNVEGIINASADGLNAGANLVNAFNGNNNQPAQPYTPPPSTNTTPKWVLPVGIGIAVLLIIGLLVYSNNNKNAKPSPPTK